MIIDRVGFSLVEAAMMWQRGHPCSEGYESPGLKLGEEGSVWSRFLFQRWCSTDIRVKELRVWFGKVWGYLQKTGGSQRPDPTRAYPSVGCTAEQASEFLRAFGVLASLVEQQRQPTPAEPAQPEAASEASTESMGDLQQQQAPAEQPAQPLGQGEVAHRSELQGPLHLATDGRAGRLVHYHR